VADIQVIFIGFRQTQVTLTFYTDFIQLDRSRPPSANSQLNGEDNPSPAKRPRTDSTSQEAPSLQPSSWQSSSRTAMNSTLHISSQQTLNGTPRPPSSLSVSNGVIGKLASQSPELDVHKPRFASKPVMPRPGEPVSLYKDSRRAAVVAAICQRDEPGPVLDLLREIFADPSNPDAPSPAFDVDIILDDQGHTALHLAASLGRQQTVDMLKTHGADIHRGNFLGETPLIRACLATHNADQQSFGTLVIALHPSIRTLDTSRKSVIHHIVSLAGVKGRAVAARYYLDQIFLWIAQQQGGDFRSIVDLQDEHGDTALNIAARVGNRSLVRTLLDVGANRILPNKLGLRPGDFGVETEVISKSSNTDMDPDSVFRS
jgi:regulatory protein SWI6